MIRGKKNDKGVKPLENISNTLCVLSIITAMLSSGSTDEND